MTILDKIFKFKDKKQRKTFIILAIISNLLFVLILSYWLFLGELLFDKDKKPFIDQTKITKIDIREGSWKWFDKEWAFTQDTKLLLIDPADIDTFCIVLKSLPSKYIDNIRPTKWLNIYLTENGSEEISVLKVNYQKEIFIEFKGHTYDGTQITGLIKSLANKHNK